MIASIGTPVPDPTEPHPAAAPKASQRFRPSLSVGVRLALLIVGWSLVLVGVVGLVLPGLQGILTLLVGAAMLSLVSDLFYRGLRRLFRRWPPAWKRFERFRRWLHRRFSRHPRHPHEP